MLEQFATAIFFQDTLSVVSTGYNYHQKGELT